MAAVLSAVAVLTTWPQASRADIPPPEDYVETCTVANHAQGGKTCVECPASFQDHQACAGLYGPQGYERVCNMYGASVWTEVWCKSSGPAVPEREGDTASSTPPAAAPEKKSGCAVTPMRARSATGLALLVALMAFLLGWRVAARPHGALCRAAKRRQGGDRSPADVGAWPRP